MKKAIFTLERLRKSVKPQFMASVAPKTGDEGLEGSMVGHICDLSTREAKARDQEFNTAWPVLALKAQHHNSAGRAVSKVGKPVVDSELLAIH